MKYSIENLIKIEDPIKCVIEFFFKMDNKQGLQPQIS